MGYFEKIDRHSDLIRRMSKRSGVDLGDEVVTGRMSAEAYRSSVFVCAGCASVEACEALLAEGGRGPAPEFCANKLTLDRFAVS